MQKNSGRWQSCTNKECLSHPYSPPEHLLVVSVGDGKVTVGFGLTHLKCWSHCNVCAYIPHFPHSLCWGSSYSGVHFVRNSAVFNEWVGLMSLWNNFLSFLNLRSIVSPDSAILHWPSAKTTHSHPTRTPSSFRVIFRLLKLFPQLFKPFLRAHDFQAHRISWVIHPSSPHYLYLY